MKASGSAAAPIPAQMVCQLVLGLAHSLTCCPACCLQLWTERLREWFASRVLQPLLAAAESAHTSPNALLAKYGQGGLRLPALPDVFGPQAAGGGGAATVAAGRGAQVCMGIIKAEGGEYQVGGCLGHLSLGRGWEGGRQQQQQAGEHR